MDPTSEQLLWMYEKMIEIREYEETMAKAHLEGKLPPKIQKGLLRYRRRPGARQMHSGRRPGAGGGGCAPTCAAGDTVAGAYPPAPPRLPRMSTWRHDARDVRQRPTGQARTGRAHAPVRPGGEVLVQRHHRCQCAEPAARRWPPEAGQRTGWRWPSSAKGAANQGSFHEALSTSPRCGKLPVIFVCEDSKYGISVEKSASTAIASNADRAAVTACRACWSTPTRWRCSTPPARRWPGARGPT